MVILVSRLLKRAPISDPTGPITMKKIGAAHSVHVERERRGGGKEKREGRATRGEGRRGGWKKKRSREKRGERGKGERH